jgi:hypothetical protein
MIIVAENKNKGSSKKEAGNSSKWDITWKEALGVFKCYLAKKGLLF